MLNYIAKNKLKKIENLKFFDEDGYQYSSKESNEKKLVFLRK